MASKTFYMACLDLDGQQCLVIGEGAMAEEKVTGLAACGATVRNVPEADYRSDLLVGSFLVIAVTADRALAERIVADAKERAMLCNIADVPDLCNFILPAIHRQGPITVGVSTGGASPALAKRLRDRIAEIIRPEHAVLAEELRAMRPEVKERFATYAERRDYFEQVVTERLA